MLLEGCVISDMQYIFAVIYETRSQITMKTRTNCPQRCEVNDYERMRTYIQRQTDIKKKQFNRTDDKQVIEEPGC